MKIKTGLPEWKVLYRHQQMMKQSASKLASSSGQPTQSTTQLPAPDLVTDFVADLANKQQEFFASDVQAGEAILNENQKPQTAAELASVQSAMDERAASYNFDKPAEPKPLQQPTAQTFDAIRQQPFAHNDPMSTVPGGMMSGPKKPAP